MSSPYIEACLAGGQGMDNPCLKDIITQERIYNGSIVVTIRDKVVIDVSIEKQGVYKRKKSK